MLELVAEGDPLLLDEQKEAFNGSVVGIQQELREGGQLSGSIPTVTGREQGGGEAGRGKRAREGYLQWTKTGWPSKILSATEAAPFKTLETWPSHFDTACSVASLAMVSPVLEPLKEESKGRIV
jgi:hypothetical protein